MIGLKGSHKIQVSTASNLKRLMVVCDDAGTGAEGASVGPGSPAYMQQNGQESPAYSNQSLPHSESSVILVTSPDNTEASGSIRIGSVSMIASKAAVFASCMMTAGAFSLLIC